MKGGELAGVILIIFAILSGGLAWQSYRIDEFKKKGIASKARILRKYISHQSKPWGIWTIEKSPRYSFIRKTDYYFDIGFFKGKKEKKTNFKFVEASFKASQKTISGIKKGDLIKIIYLPADPYETIISLKDFEDNFYIMIDALKSLYNKDGKTVDATVKSIDKDKGMVSVMVMLSSIPSMGFLEMTTISVVESVYDSFNKGDEMEILYLEDNPRIAVPKKQLESLIYVNPYILIALTIFFIVYGIYLMKRG